MKVTSNTTILIAFASLGLIALIIFVALFSFSGSDLIETENTPESLWQRKIKTQTKGDMVRVINPHDGYAITVPTSWQIPGTASGVSGLSIFYHPLGFAAQGTDFPEGVFLKILPVTPTTDVREWARQNLGAEEITDKTLGSHSGFFFTQPLKERDERLELVSIENSQQKTFLIPVGNDTFLVVSCSAQGKDYLDWIRACEERAASLEIL